MTRFGLQLWSQQSDWPGFRDAALAAEEAGWDSVWTWDHLLAIFGPWEQPIFEGWSVLSALGPLTSRIRLGLMVGANTFRNPGLTAKLATTLDHVSGGRAVLGIGGAWFEREHEAFGIDFHSGHGERLDRLDEAVMLMRRLLDGETVTHAGVAYSMTDAVVRPRPVQPRLPIMIGGSGPKKTLRTLARYGDQWNGMGRPDKLAKSDAILREHCASLGRDQAEIERTTTVDLVIRDSRDAAMAAYRARLAVTGEEFDETWNMFLGTPAEIAVGLRPILDLGFHHILVEMPAPYDLETIDRLGEVLALLNGSSGRA